MSYQNKIPAEQKSEYSSELDWDSYFQHAKLSFHRQYPSGEFGRAKLTMSKIIFRGRVIFSGDYDCELEFVDCYFLTDVQFHNTNIKKGIFFRQCYCDEEVYITKDAVFEHEFFIADFAVKRQVYIAGGTYNICKWSFTDNATVKINGGYYKDLTIGYWGGGTYDELSFQFNEVTGLIRVANSNSYIKNLRLFQFSTDLAFSLEDVHVNCLTIYRFRNEKAFRIFNVKAWQLKEPTEICVAESYLGKAEFYSVDFNAFFNVYLTDVHLTDCSFVGVKWKYNIDSFKGRGIGKSPKEEELPAKIAKLNNELREGYNEINELKHDPDVIEYFSKQREIYRQLKFAYEKQGDIINGQMFHSREMVAYNRTLNFEKSPWTKAIIKMSYWFSDFGQSFIRPLIWLLAGHLILLQILIACGHFNDLAIDLGNPSWKGFEKSFIQFFKLINPLRRAENTFDGYEIVIDLAMRVWSSYMIYNIIRATRRFIK